jgi:hypothetical protein
MATSRKIVKVFLASPGDLQDERRAAKHVVDVFNKQWAENLGIHVELVGWEDTVSQFGRPQETINRDLDQCELFIGVMWKKWGSPPSDDGKYTSGFQEEFERSVESRRVGKRPEISLLFKAIDPDLLKDPGDDLKKVIAFRNKVTAERTVLFQEFSTPLEFDDQVRGCITSYVQDLQREEAENRSNENQAAAPDTSEGGKVQSAQTSTPFSSEGTSFLRAFVEPNDRDLTVDPVTPTEVARFRLLGTRISAHGNDESVVGAHDANIIYGEKGSLSLSVQEKIGLVDAALDSFYSHNVPLWYWLEDLSGRLGGDLTFASMFGPTSRRVGALAAMRVVAEPINSIKRVSTDEIVFDREAIVRSWLTEQENRLRVAALEYLAICGTLAELPLIKTELNRGNYQTLGPATNAIIRINLRQSREDALEAIYELQPEFIDQGLLDDVLAHPRSLDSSLLLPGATHKSPQVRKAVLPILLSRDALPAAMAEQLLEDADATVRYYALRGLVAAGVEIAEDRAKAILIKPAGRAGFGLLATAIPDRNGEKEWTRFLRERLRSENLTTLERRAATEDVFGRDARFALDYKQFSKRGDALRRMVDDRFQMEFANEVAGLERKLGTDSEAVSKIKTLDGYLRKQFLREGLDIFSVEDLPRIRNALQDGFVEYSTSDVNFLKRHGEWKDIDLLVALAERPVAGASLLTAFYNSDAMDVIADAAYSIGKERFGELLAHRMPDAARVGERVRQSRR